MGPKKEQKKKQAGDKACVEHDDGGDGAVDARPRYLYLAD